MADYLGMPPMAVHEVTTFYNMYNQQPVGWTRSTSAPTCRASCATGRHWSTWCEPLGLSDGGTTADGLFTVQKSECLGACADSPVMLVNDRQMCQLHGKARIDELVDTLQCGKAMARCSTSPVPGPAAGDLPRTATIGAQIYAGPERPQLAPDDYVARGGYRALRGSCWAPGRVNAG